MKLRESITPRKSKRRARVSLIKTVVGLVVAGLALVGFLIMYLLDTKRLRADLSRWLSQIDETQRRHVAESQGQTQVPGEGGNIGGGGGGRTGGSSG